MLTRTLSTWLVALVLGWAVNAGAAFAFYGRPLSAETLATDHGLQQIQYHHHHRPRYHHHHRPRYHHHHYRPRYHHHYRPRHHHHRY